MNAKEAIDIIREWLDFCEKNAVCGVGEDYEALAVLTSLAERLDKFDSHGFVSADAFSALAEEVERLRAESNGKHWRGLAQIAALQTENATLKAEVERLLKTLEQEMGESDMWRDKAMFQQGRADEAIKIAKDMK